VNALSPKQGDVLHDDLPADSEGFGQGAAGDGTAAVL